MLSLKVCVLSTMKLSVMDCQLSCLSYAKFIKIEDEYENRKWTFLLCFFSEKTIRQFVYKYM